MRHHGEDASDEYRRDVAFLEERLQAVEREIRLRCASLVERHPVIGESIRQECGRPFGEEEPIEGLLFAADAALLRFKRERHLLEWLLEMVARVPLPRLLFEGPSLLMRRCECMDEMTQESRAYSEEYWELRQCAETLRFLWELWLEREAANKTAERRGLN